MAARFQRNRLRPNRNALNEDDGVLEGDEADEMDVDRRRRLLLAAANNALAEDGDDVLNNDDDDEMDEEAEAAEREELRKKLGTKKLAKLEEKAARRERNEQMLKEREERKARLIVLRGAGKEFCVGRASMGTPRPAVHAVKEYGVNAQAIDMNKAVHYARNIHALINTAADMKKK